MSEQQQQYFNELESTIENRIASLDKPYVRNFTPKGLIHLEKRIATLRLLGRKIVA
jgi:hypothetical protein